MLGGFYFGSFLLIGIGVLAILIGKNAIKTKQMSNSLKSSLVTRVHSFEGESAVKMGKLNVILGYVFIALGAIGLLLSIALSIAIIVLG